MPEAGALGNLRRRPPDSGQESVSRQPPTLSLRRQVLDQNDRVTTHLWFLKPRQLKLRTAVLVLPPDCDQDQFQFE